MKKNNTTKGPPQVGDEKTSDSPKKKKRLSTLINEAHPKKTKRGAGKKKVFKAHSQKENKRQMKGTAAAKGKHKTK
jgi:hypothetical protein